MSMPQRWIGRSALLAALVSAAVAGAGTSRADTAPADPGYAGKPHMGLMDPAPSTVPPGTGGIKPVRPITPIPRPTIPGPKPRPTFQNPRPLPPVNIAPPVVDPNVIGYSADGTPIYPWGPRPQPPKPVKPVKPRDPARRLVHTGHHSPSGSTTAGRLRDGERLRNVVNRR